MVSAVSLAKGLYRPELSHYGIATATGNRQIEAGRPAIALGQCVCQTIGSAKREGGKRERTADAPSGTGHRPASNPEVRVIMRPTPRVAHAVAWVQAHAATARHMEGKVRQGDIQQPGSTSLEFPRQFADPALRDLAVSIEARMPPLVEFETKGVGLGDTDPALRCWGDLEVRLDGYPALLKLVAPACQQVIAKQERKHRESPPSS